MLEVYIFNIVEIKRSKKSKHKSRKSNNLKYIDDSWWILKYKCIIYQSGKSHLKLLKVQKNKLDGIVKIII